MNDSIGSKQQGFTLVELVMVILLVGILSYGAASLFASRDAYSSYIAKDILVSQALLAQQVALGMSATSNPVSLTISATSSEWRFSLVKGSDTILRTQESTGGTMTVSAGGAAQTLPYTFTWNSEGSLTSGSDSEVNFSGESNYRVCISASGYSYESSGACP